MVVEGYPKVPLVEYEDIRAAIRSGDILLCSGSSPMSRMIQAATDSPFSHVGFLLRLESIDRIVILESVESIGIRTCSLSRYVYDYNGTGRPYGGKLYLARHTALDFTDISRLQGFSQKAVDLLGCPYDNRQIVSIAARIVAAKLGLPPKPAVHDNAFICSEFVSVCLGSVGISVPYNTANYIAPADYARCPEITFICEIRGEGQ